MPDHEVLLSAEGLKKLEEELEHLKTVKRREVAQRIKTAREFGDLSENSEYEEAKNEQAFIEGRINTLEKMLRQAKVVDQESVDPDVVHIGSTVTLKDLSTGEEFTYKIVGSNEADPSDNLISYQSPVGQAVFKRRAKDVVEVRLPGGVTKYEILAVSR